jgi:hypothetical protein
MSSILQRPSPAAAGSEADLRRTFRAAAHVVCTRQGEATVLLDLRRGLYYTLNELGWRIWEQVSAGVSPVEVVFLLRQAYDLSADGLYQDVTAFVHQLVEAALVEPADG